MIKKAFVLAVLLGVSCSSQAGLPDALMGLNYKQYSTALSEFQALANEGNAAALFYLGRMYQQGLGVPTNIPLAVSYFQAADRGFYVPAAGQLGKILLYGAGGVAPNPVRAVSLLKKAALAGDSDAAFELGNSAVRGLGRDVNYNEAYGYYLLAALKGDPKAQYQIGQMFLKGRGVTQNYQRAMIWMTRSANQGYVKAQLELAKLTETDPKLKNLGDAYAWNSILAAYNSDEIGTQAQERRDRLALKLKAKELNERQAQIRSWAPRAGEDSVPEEERKNTPVPDIPEFNDVKTLQQILVRDGALPRDATVYGLTMEMIDIAEATGDTVPVENMIQKSIKRDKIEAAGYYADLLLKRFHKPEEAAKWYQKGADLGDAYAQYQLARSYCEGWAAEPDPAKCYGWLLITRETQDPILNGVIQQALITVRDNATMDELQKGQEIAEERKKKADKADKKRKIWDFF